MADRDVLETAAYIIDSLQRLPGLVARQAEREGDLECYIIAHEALSETLRQVHKQRISRSAFRRARASNYEAEIVHHVEMLRALRLSDMDWDQENTPSC